MPVKSDKSKLEQFLDADPTAFPYWLEYLRTRGQPAVPTHLRAKVIRDTEQAGHYELASLGAGMGWGGRVFLQQEAWLEGWRTNLIARDLGEGVWVGWMLKMVLKI